MACDRAAGLARRLYRPDECELRNSIGVRAGEVLRQKGTEGMSGDADPFNAALVEEIQEVRYKPAHRCSLRQRRST
jgi:hypothetical protein